MEENKQNKGGATSEKLSYDKLQQTAGELYQANQKMYEEIARLHQRIESLSFERTSFFLQMLLKCMDHPENYSEKFRDWARENIESILVAFSQACKEEDEAKAECNKEN